MQPTFPQRSGQRLVDPTAPPPPSMPVDAPVPRPTRDRAPTKQFRTKRKRVEFYVDDDLFICAPTVPAQILIDTADLGVELQTAANRRKVELVLEIFEQFMVDESYERFKNRLSSKENPIDFDTLLGVVQWLFGEAYAMRPTLPSLPSMHGSPTTDSGTNSTDGEPTPGSTSDDSPGPSSSTSPTTSS